MNKKLIKKSHSSFDHLKQSNNTIKHSTGEFVKSDDEFYKSF